MGTNFEVKTNFSGRSVSKKYVWRVMVQIKFTEELSLTLMLVVMVVCVVAEEIQCLLVSQSASNICEVKREGGLWFMVDLGQSSLDNW